MNGLCPHCRKSLTEPDVVLAKTTLDDGTVIRTSLIFDTVGRRVDTRVDSPDGMAQVNYVYLEQAGG